MSSGAWAGIAVVIIIIIVVLALLFTGVIPGFHLGSSGTSSSGPSFNVTFNETGLTSAVSSWSVTLNSQTKSATPPAAIVFSEPNGTYSWSVAAVGSFSPHPASGSMTVSGAAKTQSITFTALAAGTFTATFTESGLGAGTSWTVDLNGTSMSSSNPSIVFDEKNGSYPFTIPPVTGFSQSPSTGTIPVNGGPATQAVTFTANSTTGGSGQDTYSQALSNAAPVAASHGGGVPIIAGGIDVTSTWSNSSAPAFNSTCNLTGGSGHWPTISGYTGNYATGSLSAWFFLYYQNSTNTSLFIGVQGSTATLVGMTSGSNCSFPSYFTGIQSGVIDSTTAATDFSANHTVASYESAHSSATAEFVLVSGYNITSSFGNFSGPATWSAHFTTCSPTGGGGTGTNLSADMDANNGTITYANISTGACGTASFRPAGPPGDLAPAMPPTAALVLRGE